MALFYKARIIVSGGEGSEAGGRGSAAFQTHSHQHLVNRRPPPKAFEYNFNLLVKIGCEVNVG